MAQTMSFGQFLRALAVVAGQVSSDVFLPVAALGLADMSPDLKQVLQQYKYGGASMPGPPPLNLDGKWQEALPGLDPEGLMADARGLVMPLGEEQLLAAAQKASADAKVAVLQRSSGSGVQPQPPLHQQSPGQRAASLQRSSSSGMPLLPRTYSAAVGNTSGSAKQFKETGSYVPLSPYLEPVPRTTFPVRSTLQIQAPTPKSPTGKCTAACARNSSSIHLLVPFVPADAAPPHWRLPRQLLSVASSFNWYLTCTSWARHTYMLVKQVPALAPCKCQPASRHWRRPAG